MLEMLDSDIVAIAEYWAIPVIDSLMNLIELGWRASPFSEVSIHSSHLSIAI